MRASELVPLLVRDARQDGPRLGPTDKEPCPLDTILDALEALPVPEAAPIQSSPPAE